MVKGESDFGSSSTMTISVDGPDAGSDPDVDPSVLEGAMTHTGGDNFVFTFPTTEDLVGRRVLISTDHGGSYNDKIKKGSGGSSGPKVPSIYAKKSQGMDDESEGKGPAYLGSLNGPATKRQGLRPEYARELLGTLSKGHGPWATLRIVESLIGNVDVSMNALLIDHVERVLTGAQKSGRADLVMEAKRLLSELEEPE